MHLINPPGSGLIRSSHKDPFSAIKAALRLIVLSAAGLTMSAIGQNLAVDLHTVAGGGGMSTNGQFAAVGTIGQPAVSRLTAGRYSIDSGFWRIIAAVQTPGAPLLKIHREPSGAIAVSWPTQSEGYALYTSANLGLANWTVVFSAPADDGTTRTVVLNPAQGTQFFRLVKP